jgi:hypothetical protein
MNTGQVMLTIGALALLSMITMRYYSSIGNSGQTLVQTNGGLTATTIATSYIERAQNTAFDEKSSGTPINLIQASPNLLTRYDSLGIDSPNEALSLDSLDDFDDFKYYSQTNPITYHPGNINETYKVAFDVYYVDTSDIMTKVNSYRFLKKMDVKVWRVDPMSDSKGFDTVRMSAIYGLFRFN